MQTNKHTGMFSLLPEIQLIVDRLPLIENPPADQYPGWGIARTLEPASLFNIHLKLNELINAHNALVAKYEKHKSVDAAPSFAGHDEGGIG